MAYPRRLETARLVGEVPDPARHLDGFAELCAAEAVADWMWPRHLGGPRTREQSHDILVRAAAHWTAKDFGMWMVRERDGGRLVGQVGLQYTVVGGRGEVEVGWLLDPGSWGRGYATEMAVAALEHAGGIRALETVVAFTMVENVRAVRVMERCGLAYERDVIVVDLPHVLYRRAVGYAASTTARP